MKDIFYSFRNAGGHLDSERLLIDVSDIKAMKPCYNKESTEIYFKSKGNLSVRIPMQELIKLLEIKKD